MLAKSGFTGIKTVETAWGGLILVLQAGQFDSTTGVMNILRARGQSPDFGGPMASFAFGVIRVDGKPQSDLA